MSVEIVVHRGFKNVLYDNSMVGILAAVFRNKFCELDILWTEGTWKVCHDMLSLNVFHIRLSDLLAVFQQYKHLVKHGIIIDIKWDFVWNRQDDLSKALFQLRQELVGFEEFPFWLQASHPIMVDSLHRYCSGNDIPSCVWKVGMIVMSVADFNIYQPFLDYAMIGLADFCREDIAYMSKHCLLFGYTCHNTNELCQYKHLFPYLKGIVCDVSL